MPLLEAARSSDKKAVIVVDKLYVNNNLQTPTPFPTGSQ